MKRIIIIGAGGHARSVCDILAQNPENEVVGLIDDPKTEGFWGLKILGDDDTLPEILKKKVASHVFVALGNNHRRKQLFNQVMKLGFQMVNAISPHAIVSPHAHLGQGLALMPGAIIGPNAVIGDGSIINTNASVDHDGRIGSFCHIAPGSTLCGAVEVGDSAFICAGARVIDGLSIGEGAIIGSGAVVIRDIPPFCTAVGVPARTIKLN